MSRREGWSPGWGDAGPGPWFEGERGPRALHTNRFVPRKECRPEMEAPPPAEAAPPRSAESPRTAAAEPAAAPVRPAAAEPVTAPAGGLPPPSPPTADTYAGEGAPEVVVLDGPAEPHMHGAEFGGEGFGGEGGAGGTCGDPSCPFCENVRVCPATGKRYTPVSPEASAVFSRMLGPILTRAPYRGVEPEKLKAAGVTFDMTEQERKSLDEAMYLFLRRRGHMLGPIDDVLALAGACAMVVAPRVMHAAELRDPEAG